MASTPRAVKVNRHQRRSIYTACEDIEFHWDLKQVMAFDQLWIEGLSIWEIAVTFKRDPDDIVALAMDRARKKKIYPRPGGLFGTSLSTSVKEKEAQSCVTGSAFWHVDPIEG